MFYVFDQNNSGGHFTVDHKRGIAHYVIIEADDSMHANTRAEEIGLYFNGVYDEIDCDCCGDRWNEADTWSDPTEDPRIYGEEPVLIDTDSFPDTARRYIYIHYKNGRVQKAIEPKYPWDKE